MNLLEMILSPILGIIDKAIPDRAEADRMKAEITQALIEQQSELNQTMKEIAVKEVSGSGYQRNWRPTLAWMVIAMWPYNFIARPILSNWGVVGELPEIDPQAMTVITGMWGTVYGLGRSFEKSGSSFNFGGPRT